MANGNTRRTTSTRRPGGSSTSSSSDGKIRDGDLVTWLIGFLFFALVIGGVFRVLSEKGFFQSDSRVIEIGAIVLADGEIDVWEEAGGENLLGTQKNGSRGVVTDGPENIDEEIWWYVDFEVDPDGWVLEDDIFIDPESLGIGAIIEMIRTAGVWDTVGGGTTGGLQFIGALGKIVDGPGFFGDEPWWKVDFNDGPDGWVRESDIRVAPSFIVRLWEKLLDYILIPSIILSAVLITAIVILLTRINRVVKALAEKYKSPKTSSFVRSVEERTQGNERWNRVEDLASSTEPGNWRLAILEADIMLDDIVRRMGYVGEGLGERLKQVEKSDFVTLDKAWEAHKIRNSIAHEGGDFILTQREARRIIGLYKEVFQEFHYV